MVKSVLEGTTTDANACVRTPALSPIDNFLRERTWIYIVDMLSYACGDHTTAISSNSRSFLETIHPHWPPPHFIITAMTSQFRGNVQVATLKVMEDIDHMLSLAFEA
jgi:hypothetical protein